MYFFSVFSVFRVFQNSALRCMQTYFFECAQAIVEGVKYEISLQHKTFIQNV